MRCPHNISNNTAYYWASVPAYIIMIQPFTPYISGSVYSQWMVRSNAWVDDQAHVVKLPHLNGEDGVSHIKWAKTITLVLKETCSEMPRDCTVQPPVM